MIYNRKDWLNKSGIYYIKNNINDKLYIGKAKCIYSRLKDHTTRLNTKNKDENIHLIRAWYKYGKHNFSCGVIEFCSLEDCAEAELAWIDYFDVIDTGYNLRLDSDTGLIVSEETRKRLSFALKRRWENYSDSERKRYSAMMSDFWKNNPEAKSEMSKKVSKIKSKYKFHQYDMEMSFIKTWDSINDIKLSHPEYHLIAIYSVCNGHKKSYRGFIWRKELKI